MDESLRNSLPDLKEALLRAGVVNSGDLQWALGEQAKSAKKHHFLDMLLDAGKCDEKNCEMNCHRTKKYGGYRSGWSRGNRGFTSNWNFQFELR